MACRNLKLCLLSSLFYIPRQHCRATSIRILPLSASASAKAIGKYFLVAR